MKMSSEKEGPLSACINPQIYFILELWSGAIQIHSEGYNRPPAHTLDTAVPPGPILNLEPVWKSEQSFCNRSWKLCEAVKLINVTFDLSFHKRLTWLVKKEPITEQIGQEPNLSSPDGLDQSGDSAPQRRLVLVRITSVAMVTASVSMTSMWAVIMSRFHTWPRLIRTAEPSLWGPEGPTRLQQSDAFRPGNTWKLPGNTWKIPGSTWKTQRKHLDRPGKHLETSGKYLETPEKYLENTWIDLENTCNV